jgi:hypothetical protein
MEEKETKTIKFPEKDKKPLPNLGKDIGVTISLPRVTFTENSSGESAHTGNSPWNG